MLVHDYIRKLFEAIPQARCVDLRYINGPNKCTMVNITFREEKPMRDPRYFLRHAEAKIYAPQSGAERVLVQLTLRHMDIDRSLPDSSRDRIKQTKQGKYDFDLTEDMDELVRVALAYILEGKIPDIPRPPVKS